MTSKRRGSPILPKVSAFTGIGLATAGLADIEYDVKVLPRPGGFSFVRGWDINEHGQVVGDLILDDPPPDEIEFRPFVWDEAGGLRLLSLLDGFRGGFANEINNKGEIVGVLHARDTGDGSARVVRWANGGVEDRGSGALTGGGVRYSLALNDAGQYAFQNGDLPGAGIFFNGLTDVVIRNDASTFPGGMNDQGTVVGRTRIDHDYRAFEWSESDGLSLVEDRVSGVTLREASQISEQGQIIGGGYWDGNGEYHDQAFLVNQNGEFVEVDPRDSGVSIANDINDLGVIVGGYLAPSEAFVFDEDQGLRRLVDLVDPDLDLRLREAVAITEDGRILVKGSLPGEPGGRTFLLTPVPSPASVIVVFGLLAVRERRARDQLL